MIIFNPEEILLPKLYFESESKKGILKVNGESLVLKELYELRSKLDFVSSEPGTIHIFYSRYIRGFNIGRFTFAVYSCGEGYYNHNGKYICTKNKSCDVPGLSYLEPKEGQCVNSCSDQNCIKCKKSTLESKIA